MKALTTFSLLLLVFFTSCEDPNAAADAAAAEAAAAKEAALTEAANNYIKAWNGNDHELMLTLVAEDMVRVANGQTMSTNTDDLKAGMDYWHTAMNDFNLQVEDIAVKGNKTYTSWKSTGTNTGPLGDAPPTGGAGVAHGFTMMTHNDDGIITNEVAYFDLLGFFTSWGYSLQHPAAAASGG